MFFDLLCLLQKRPALNCIKIFPPIKFSFSKNKLEQKQIKNYSPALEVIEVYLTQNTVLHNPSSAITESISAAYLHF